MDKDEFSIIISRQQQSGLGIRDFCINEGYAVSSFRYWKSKFGYGRSSASNSARLSKVESDAIRPISIQGVSPVADFDSIERSEVCITLPNGTQMSFKGSAAIDNALRLANQICLAHVLPE